MTVFRDRKLQTLSRISHTLQVFLFARVLCTILLIIFRTIQGLLTPLCQNAKLGVCIAFRKIILINVLMELSLMPLTYCAFGFSFYCFHDVRIYGSSLYILLTVRLSPLLTLSHLMLV